MNNMFKLFGSLVCFYFVSPVFTHYIFDENPNGYLSAAYDGEDFVKNRLPTHKKFYKVSNSQNLKLLNERKGDVHFKSQRASPSTLADVSMNSLIANILNDVNSNNHRQQKTPANNVINNPKMEKKYEDVDNHFKTTTYRNENTMRNNGMYFIPNKNPNASKRLYDEYQRNAKLNQYRFQQASDNQKNGSISNSKLNSPEHNKAHISDNQEHKTKNRNAKETLPASETQQRSNANISKQDENRKRDIAGKHNANSASLFNKENEKFVSFNGGLKQLQPGLHLAKHVEERVEKNYRNNVSARIRKYNLQTKANNKPYALFYVMNHENSDQPDRIISEDIRSYDQKPINHNYNSVTNFKNTDTKNQYVNNYAVFRDR